MKRNHEQILKSMVANLEQTRDAVVALSGLRKEFFTDAYYLQGSLRANSGFVWGMAGALIVLYLFSVLASIAFEWNNGLILLVELLVFVIVSAYVFVEHFRVVNQCRKEPYVLKDALEQKLLLSKKLRPHYRNHAGLLDECVVCHEFEPLEYFDFLQRVARYIQAAKKQIAKVSAQTAGKIAEVSAKLSKKATSLKVSALQKQKIAEMRQGGFKSFHGKMPECSEAHKALITRRRLTRVINYSAV
ncbi:hypothetical protein [Thiomicrorhabdus xiamenensis]|uniref:Uncharacterized protein n=1 Tax=Thiomicrorhabdus xiamenensis TaxID=2739063 RepID=A0A7D4TF83_9GAMM|nr:hypothetical protein [Thiomicrorhabdus xiamenensis]QKI89947.1 hypothetical protein HQN79_10355 [Thiomicrorhabdus xiamenensis]